MFPKMRRPKQQLALEECQRILARNTAGVLGTCGTEGYPYAVPLSYVYLTGEGDKPPLPLGRIMFHCSRKGRKLDALRANPRVSFCVVDQDVVIPEEFATYYKSVIAFGTTRFVEEPSEKRELLMRLGLKYGPELEAEAKAEIDRLIDATCVVVIDVEHLTGKQAKGLAN